jgi:PhnB protein
MLVQPYLNFNGRCDEALEFYRRALGAEVVTLMRFKDSPDPQMRAMAKSGTENKIIHASFRVGDTELMCSDGQCHESKKFDGISLSISVPDVATAEKLFTALADGGQVQMPVTKTFFSPGFGMVTDRFEVSWMLVTCVPRNKK